MRCSNIFPENRNPLVLIEFSFYDFDYNYVHTAHNYNIVNIMIDRYQAACLPKTAISYVIPLVINTHRPHTAIDKQRVYGKRVDTEGAFWFLCYSHERGSKQGRISPPGHGDLLVKMSKDGKKIEFSGIKFGASQTTLVAGWDV